MCGDIHHNNHYVLCGYNRSRCYFQHSHGNYDGAYGYNACCHNSSFLCMVIDTIKMVVLGLTCTERMTSDTSGENTGEGISMPRTA